MQGDRKKIGLLIIILGALIIALIVYFLIIKKSSRFIETPLVEEIGSGEVVGTEPPATNPSNVPINSQNYDLGIQEAPRAINGDDLGKLSMSLAERFGSFSNQSNYGNFTDLKIMMTSDMKTWVDSYIEDLKAQPKNNDNIYYGVTTKAINYQVKNFNDATGNAEVIVNTQRRESTDTINGGEAYSQDLRLILVKVDGNWLLDAAYWSK